MPVLDAFIKAYGPIVGFTLFLLVGAIVGLAKTLYDVMRMRVADLVVYNERYGARMEAQAVALNLTTQQMQVLSALLTTQKELVQDLRSKIEEGVQATAAVEARLCEYGKQNEGLWNLVERLVTGKGQ